MQLFCSLATVPAPPHGTQKYVIVQLFNDKCNGRWTPIAYVRQISVFFKTYFVRRCWF